MSQADRTFTPVSASERRGGEIVSIQQLRGLAAFGVLCFHAAQRAGVSFGVGAAGVDVFFAISGFIMWVVTARGESRPSVFLERRVLRIVPLYWLVTLALAGLALAAPALFPAMRPEPAHLIKSLLFLPHRDPSGQVYPLLVPGWTLNYEAFFYLVFAATLLLPRRWRAPALTLALGGLVLARSWLDTTNPLVATYTDPLLLEFTAGVWLGVAWTHRALVPPALAWAGLVIGLIAFAAMQSLGVDVGVWRPLAWGVPAFLIVAGAVSLEQHGKAPVWRPLERLGDASYALYLVHGLAVSFAFRALALVHVTAPAPAIACAIVAGLASGLCVHLWLERPLTALFRRKSARRPASAPLAPPQGAG